MQIENMTIKTAKDIEALQGVNLGRFLGLITGSTVSKIRDRAAAVAKAVEAFKAQGEKPVDFEAYIIETKDISSTKPARTRATKTRKPAKVKKVKAAKKSNGERKPRARKPFDFKPRKNIKAHREGTKRDTVIKLLTGKGATFEQIMKKTGWDHRTAYEGTRLLNTHLGYGLTEKDGVIKIVKA